MPEAPTRGQQDQASLSAYPETERKMRKELTMLDIRLDTLKRSIERCDLSICRGMCCYDGIYVNDETADVIQKIATEKADFFRNLGLDLPENVIVQGEWRGEISGKKTAVRFEPFSRTVPGYPRHFEDTACVFHMQNGRCGLQALSVSEGLHPWYYKPTGCWMHPLSLSNTKELQLHDDQDDPHQFPDYAGYVSNTFCGRTVQKGRTAYVVLADEIDFLSQIVDQSVPGESAHQI